MSRINAWVVVGAVAVIALLWLRVRSEHAQAIRNALARDSIEAVSDTTKHRLNGDLALAERRIVQAENKRDSLDKALKRTTGLLAHLSATVRPIDTSVAGVVTSDTSDDIRRAIFRFDETPFHVRALAELPRPAKDSAPARLATLTTSIRLDTARFALRTQCGQPIGGIRSASILLEGPPWLNFGVDSGQQSPIYCNPNILKEMHGGTYYALRGGAIAALIFGGLRATGVIH